MVLPSLLEKYIFCSWSMLFWRIYTNQSEQIAGSAYGKFGLVHTDRCLNASTILEILFLFFGLQVRSSNPQSVLCWIRLEIFLVRQKDRPIHSSSLNVGFMTNWSVPSWIGSFDNSNFKGFVRKFESPRSAKINFARK